MARDENYEKMRRLVSNIDDYSESAQNISKLSEKIKSGNGTAKFFVHTDEGTSTTDLSKELSIVLCNDILERYHELIRKCKEEINSIIDSMVEVKE